MNPTAPENTVLDLLYGRWRSQTLHAGTALGVFECVTSESQPVPAADVARSLGLNAALCYRLLRALGSMGLLAEHAGRRFTVTQAGTRLRADHPQSMRDVVLLREGPEHTAVWKHLTAIVRDGQQDGFAREYGVDAFAHAAREPTYGKAFDAGMSSHSRMQTAWTQDALRGCDLGTIPHLCDVGGGQGHLLAHLLLQHPGMTGTVVDRPSVIDDAASLWAGRLGVGGRCRYVAGDMFVQVPAADGYIMKMILHDWNDDECVRILGNLHTAGAPACRLFIVEHVIPDDGKPDFAALFDMHMMCWGTGRERTVAEYRQLLEASGWRFVASRFPASGAIGVIEAAKLA